MPDQVDLRGRSRRCHPAARARHARGFSRADTFNFTAAIGPSFSYEQVGQKRYFKAAGFPGPTAGIDLKSKPDHFD